MLNSSEELTNFELFCGSTFWDDTLSWNTPNETLPDFTRCFQQTVSWIPCGFLWVSFPFYLYYLSTVKVEYKQKLSTLSATKTIISLMLAALSLFDLGYAVAVRYYNKDTDSYLYLPPSAYFSASLEFVTMLLASVLVQSYRLSGKFTSGVLWCYWGLWTLGSLIPFYSEIVHFVEVNSIDDIPGFVTKTVYFSLCLLQFILSCISDANLETRQRFEDVCPELLSSFLSYLTFSWFAPTVSLGYKKDLLKEDLWKLGDDNASKGHIPAFEADWNAEVARWRHQKQNNERYSGFGGDDDMEPIIEPLRTPKEPKLSLIGIIAKHYGGSLMTGFACKFAYDWLQYCGPMLQNSIIAFVSTRTGELPPGTPVDPVWQGYVLAALLFVCQLTMSILFQQLWYRSLEVGMRVRASVISVIYKKALKMTSQAKQDSTVGEIVNLMAVDAQRMQDVFQYLWMLWSAPLQIIVALYLLYVTIGPSLFVGFGILIFSMPVSAAVSLRQKKIQTQQMKLKDERVRIMNEVLSGIKVIKLYAWEPSFEEKVGAIRKKEMETIARNWTCQAIQFSIFASLSSIVSAATYAVYVCITPDHILSSSIAFVTLSLFNILRVPLIQLPISLSFSVMAKVSATRIAAFFKNTDLSEDNVENDDSCDVSIRVSNGTFSWLPDTAKILHNVNLEVPTGSLTAIVGQVGCGKSSLLAACVGDMHKHSGTVVTKGAVAFVAQQAWIQNATVRDNILFGQDFDRKKYDKIVEAVALKPDFRILDQGDQTFIGEKGINLSGGQKQRVSLARACYSNANVFLLDDPLSAVDAHVGKHIFENVIGPNGLLKGMTRVLVTHGMQWLPMVDNIAVMSDSRITESGTYDGLLAQKGAFADFINTYANPDENIEQRKELETLSHQSGATGKTVVIDAPPRHHETQRQLSMSAILSMSVRHGELEGTQGAMSIREEDDVVMHMENVESGNVSAAVYKLYLKSMGYLWDAVTLFNLTAITVFTSVSSIWLSAWTDDETFLPSTTGQYSKDQIWAKTEYYLVVYCLLTIARTAFAAGTAFSFAKCSVSASGFLHEMLLSKIMKAQMMFFDTKPLGMIMNRFSKDIDAIDNLLGLTVLTLNLNMTLVISTAIIIIYTAPLFVVIIIAAGFVYIVLQRYFISTVRQLKRWEAVTRSPIFTHFSETVTGAETIRAFAVQDRFIQKSEDLVEENVLFFYSGWVANRWLSVRLQVMAATVIGLTGLFCVMSTQIDAIGNNISSSIAGLALSYALLITSSLDVLARTLTDLETNIVSIERVKEYSDVPLEANWIDDEEPPPRQWPARGAIQFRRYATRYRPELDLVLKELDFSIKPQEKVGIVGRTGAGKSSMTLAIFRLIEAARGSIYIDGVNIGAIGLHQLRNKITILPQDPVLFSGTMRENLDPFHEYEDSQIWEALEQSFLKEYVEKQAEKLEYDCGEGGENLSVGQRQLICLARALLRKTKILVLDEATAAVDLETDDLIQQTVRTAFADCTILTIAHRLNTIMDSDRILVLDKGKVAEFDTPENLLENEDSLFSGLAVEVGIKVKQNGN